MMTKILDRTERPSPIQILKDGANHIYETDKAKAKANSFHRIYALNCKPDSMPTGPQSKQLKRECVRGKRSMRTSTYLRPLRSSSKIIESGPLLT